MSLNSLRYGFNSMKLEFIPSKRLTAAERKELDKMRYEFGSEYRREQSLNPLEERHVIAGSEFLVARSKENSQLVGYVDSNAQAVFEVYVKPEFRRNKTGYRLLAAAMRKAGDLRKDWKTNPPLRSVGMGVKGEQFMKGFKKFFELREKPNVSVKVQRVSKSVRVMTGNVPDALIKIRKARGAHKR